MTKSYLTALAWTCLGVAMTGGHALAAAPGKPTQPPNVIVVLTDDQGYGDFSCHGNPVLKTPHVDRLHDQSVRLTDFHVSPMCTPTRSQIMTGRDCLANGAYVVCSGHGFIREGISTAADVFAGTLFSHGGYRTGIFGKWHLGDNYPYRPQDRGFQETLTFRGWGLTGSQTYWNTSYYNDRYLHNGTIQQYHGYCTDVWFNEAMQWMKDRAQRNEPFFAYLPTNAPHGPLWVPEKYAAPYKGKVKPAVADFFGMIANIDENMGRLDAFLKESGLYDNTILVFMTDNGGTVGVPVWNAGMRGKKTEYYDGGHRVPCFVRWPAGGLRQPADVDELTECQDLLPTLIDLCGLRKPEGIEFNGMSLASLLRGGAQPELANRKLVVQYGIWEEYRGPTKWNCAVMWGKWRLVRGTELYDIKADPAQKTNLAEEHPQVVAALRDHYEKWWARTEPLARTFHPIHLGSERENPVYLGSQDWVDSNSSNADWIREGIRRNGPWHVLVEREGQYEISLRRWPAEADAAIAAGVPAFQGVVGGFAAGKALPIVKARLKVADVDQSRQVAGDDKAATFQVHLPAGVTELQTRFYDRDGQELCGAYYVYVTRTADASNSLPPLYAFCVEEGVPGLKPRPIAEQAKLFRELAFAGAAYPLWLDDQLNSNLQLLDQAGLQLSMAFIRVNLKDATRPYDPRVVEALSQLKGRSTTICVLLGGFKPGDAQGRALAERILRELGDLAAPYGLRISIYHHVGDWTESLPFALEVAKNTARPNVGVNFNLCHWLKVEGDKDYRPLVRENAAKIFAVTINGAKLGTNSWTNGLIQPLDQGDFDNRTLLATLREAGYRGPIGLMCYGVPGDPRDYLARSMKAWQQLNQSHPRPRSDEKGGLAPQ